MSAPTPTCIQSYKNCFQWTSIIFAFVAAVLGMAACASYSKKPGVQMNVPFMIQPTYQKIGNNDPVLQAKYYFGLSGYTAWDDKHKATYDYTATYDMLKCDDTDAYMPYVSNANANTKLPLMPLGCLGLKTCSTTGKVSMAFTCLGFLTALITMIFANMRRQSDSWTKKIMSIIFSLASLLCSMIAFLAFGACMSYITQSYSPAQNPAPTGLCVVTTSCDPQSADCCGNTGTSNVIYPGPGAGLSLTSIFLFVCVFAFSIAIPASDESIAAAKDAGLSENNV